MSFTEFCCRSGGSNLNAGTLKGDSTEPGVSPSFEYAAGNWDATTGVFTVASGNPLTDGVAVGDFSSVYADGSTVTGLIARVTARDATTITVSLTVKAGAAPTNGTGNRTLRIGGAWLGPNAASGFPFSLATLAALKNVAGDVPRFNLKNDSTYSIIAAVTSASAGPYVISGYTNAYGDYGQALIQGPATGAAFNLLNISGDSVSAADLKLDRCGNSGNAYGLYWTGFYGFASRITCSNIRSIGIYWAQEAGQIVECEVFACNIANGGVGGIQIGATADGTTVLRCSVHDGIGSNCIGIVTEAGSQTTFIFDCQIFSNGATGIVALANGLIVDGCDIYFNGGSGISISATVASAVLIENCNLIKNNGYGITGSATTRRGYVRNCVFGSGTQANTSGTTNALYAIEESGSITYTANETPWTDPDNGNFTLSGAACRGTGRGTFATYNGAANPTVSKPDIGSASRGGTFPTEAQVETGVTFGAAGTEYTGTFAGGGGYTYGDEDPDYVLTTAGGPGTYVPIADSDTVDGGVLYGAGEEGTGVNSTTIEGILDARGITTDNIALTQQPLSAAQTETSAQTGAAAAIADAGLSAAGTGPMAVTITIDDGTTEVPNAEVTVYDAGVPSGWGETDEDGEIVINLAAGTYQVVIYHAGYTSTPQTLVVPDDGNPTYSITAITPTGSTDPAWANVYANVYDEDGELEADVVCSLRIVKEPTGSGHIFGGAISEATSDANGQVTWPKRPVGCQIEYWRGSATQEPKRFKKATIAAADVTAGVYWLPKIVGHADAV